MRIALLPLLLLVACPITDDDDSAPTDDDDSAPADDDDAPLEPNFTAIQLRLSERCGCHATQNRGDFTGLSSYDGAYDALVNAPSRDLPDMFRVAPFDPENSYLMHKLDGTQGDVGGSGSRMPPSQGGLREAERSAVRAWIEAGAPKD